MKTILISLSIAAVAIITLTCSSSKQIAFKPKEIYKSSHLIVTQISGNAFEHTSFLQTNDFGNVPCNGLVVSNSSEAVVFDTPTNDTATAELLTVIKETLRCKIKAVIPTHFHSDCLGGLEAFHKDNIPSYAYFKTIELAKENKFIVPQHSFSDSLIIKVGNEKAIVKFFGEGHTRDNVVGYFPGENILFGGCLIKERGASKGYLGDANVEAWSHTVEKVKKEYQDVQVVVPGHGKYGTQKLLDYTINLFKPK